MKRHVIQYYIIVAALFIWVGFIGAISFMEAWLKFQGEGVTLAIGLSIGSLVFNALNRVELVLGTLILILLLIHRKRYVIPLKLMLLPYSLLLIQSLYLLPVLDERAHAIIRHQTVVDSYHHIYYVGIEFIKITALLFIGMQILNHNENKHEHFSFRDRI